MGRFPVCSIKITFLQYTAATIESTLAQCTSHRHRIKNIKYALKTLRKTDPPPRVTLHFCNFPKNLQPERFALFLDTILFRKRHQIGFFIVHQYCRSQNDMMDSNKGGSEIFILRLYPSGGTQVCDDQPTWQGNNIRSRHFLSSQTSKVFNFSYSGIFFTCYRYIFVHK